LCPTHAPMHSYLRTISLYINKVINDSRHITTEIATAKPFYYAEDDHQQYLYKNPHGYCGIGGIGVCLPPQA
ncbi:peptide-methionine (S)-S-oxide reductase, partial [Klebsiella pneumoniae]|uniref:peptide-methionine (S)-S-oxide reductase n=1 Tax=Klebsiella pneumoniae TaxID=573 RepID=UPI002164E41A